MPLQETIVSHFNYWVYVILMMIGLYAMVSKNNLMKKLFGMVIFQSAIILFYVSLGVKDEATIPIYEHDLLHPPAHEAGALEDAPHNSDALHEEAHEPNPERKLLAPAHPDMPKHIPHPVAAKIDVTHYANPLPHVLMLTAIVVGVATLGVGLALSQRIYRHYGSLEEDEVLAAIKAEEDTAETLRGFMPGTSEKGVGKHG